MKYTKSSFLAIPLTSRPLQNRWGADSDIDGIADEAEPALGFDPNNRRTGGVIDGVCRLLGGPSDCRAFVAARACSMLVNNFGLTGCDLAALGFPATENVDAGIDSDGDGIPDAVEVLRGTEPGSIDAVLDSDGDGVSNVGEIRRGSLVDTPDAGRDPKQFLSITEYRSTDQSGCPEGQEVWGFSVENIPLPDVNAFDDAGVTHPGTQAGQRRELSLSHGKNEHLIFLGFHASPVGRVGASGQQLGTVVRIRKDGYTGQPIIVNPSDFVLLGETQNE